MGKRIRVTDDIVADDAAAAAEAGTEAGLSSEVILTDFFQMRNTLHSYYDIDGMLHQYDADPSQSSFHPTLTPPNATHVSFFFYSLTVWIALSPANCLSFFLDACSCWCGYASRDLPFGRIPGDADTKDACMYACMHVCMCVCV